MADAHKSQGKVEIKIGNLSFTGEGDQEWLGEQLSKVIDAALKTPMPSEVVTPDRERDSGGPPESFSGSLATYIKEKGGESKQVQRFLATAAWLFNRGQKNLTAPSIAKALSDSHQKKLANAADSLNQNVSKGYCEKTKDGFFITPEGWKALGERDDPVARSGGSS